MTLNGRIGIERRYYHFKQAQGGLCPIDIMMGVPTEGPAVTRGVREVVCLTNLHAGSFEHTMQCLAEMMSLSASKELLRRVVEIEGRRAIDAQQRMLPASWDASDCRVSDEVTRVYVGCDGVKAPMVTDAEKRKRREKVVATRRARPADAPALPPLPRRRKGADQAYKEFKVVLHYSEDGEHRHASITRHNHRQAQVLMSRDARKVGLRRTQGRPASRHREGRQRRRRRLDPRPARRRQARPRRHRPRLLPPRRARAPGPQADLRRHP